MEMPAGENSIQANSLPVIVRELSAATLISMPRVRSTASQASAAPIASRNLASKTSSQAGESLNADPADGRLQFEAEAMPVLTELSQALGALINALPEPIEGPRELERAMEIDYVLAWRTYKVATSADPIAAGADVPRAAPMKRLLDAAERRQIKPAILNRIRKAYDAFSQLVHRHAGEGPKRGPETTSRGGGRAAFDALIGGIHQDAPSNVDMVNRRAAYKGNSYTWGIQAQAMLNCGIFHPGSSPELTDGFSINGFTKVHPLRRNTPLHLMFRAAAVAHREDHAEQSVRRPFERTDQEYLLEEFSTRPFPALDTRPGANNMMDVSLRFENIGKASAIDVFTARSVRNAPHRELESLHSIAKALTVPTEVLIQDLLVPVGWTVPETVRVTTHGNPALFETVWQRVPEFEMPVKETAMHLGTDLNALETPEIPRYVEMMGRLLNDLGWAGTTFDIYRCRVRYPIMHSLVYMRVKTSE